MESSAPFEPLVKINYSLKPSDSLHVAVMLNNSIKKILTEDKDFDKIK